MEEVLGRGSIGKCISEWFPMLREHSASWVSNFDSIIRLFVVRGRNHEPITEESILRDLRAAKIPTLYTVDWSNPASALKPAVPVRERRRPVPGSERGDGFYDSVGGDWQPTATATQTRIRIRIQTKTHHQKPRRSARDERRRGGPRRLADVTVFEFGSVTASADKVTLAGFCPVSDELEPCRWEILPASSSDAPQFRVVF
ncbi:hypothetical protein CFP56_032908 [Quercus suber]|uniref:Uncharacterized protein n=1 Tax=Quercus suber TaxID=58331 RepID=A0AAW0LSX1_QUESU